MAELELAQDPSGAPPGLELAVQPSAQPRPTAQDNVISGSFGSPDKAAAALTLAPKVQVPAGVINLNPEPYQQDADRKAGLEAVNANSTLKSFIEESPVHAAAAKDDWNNLVAATNTMGYLTPQGHEDKVDASLLASSPESTLEAAYLKKLQSPFADWVAKTKEQTEKNNAAFWSAFADKSQVDKALDELEQKNIIDARVRRIWELSFIPAGGRALEGLISTSVGALKYAASDISQRFITVGGEAALRKGAEALFTETGSGLDARTGPEKFQQDVQTAVDAELTRSMAEHGPVVTHAQMVENFNYKANRWLSDPKFGEVSTEVKGFQEPTDSVRAGANARNDITEYLRQNTTGNWDPAKFNAPEMKQFAAEKAGAKPVGEPIKPGDDIKVVKAEVAAESVDDAIASTKNSKLFSRSPEVFQKMMDSDGNVGNVHIDAQAILDLYKGAKRLPAPGDGLLGDVPDLMQKATEAASTGGEVTIPLSHYIVAAASNPTLHAELAEHLRLHDDGTTVHEAQVLKHTEPNFGEVHPDVIAHLATVSPEAFPTRKLVEEPVEPKEGEEAEEPEVKLPTDQAKSAVQRELEAEEALEAAKEAQAKKQAETGEEPEPEAAAGSLEAKEEGAVEPTEEGLAPAKQEVVTRAKGGIKAKRVAEIFGANMYGDPAQMDVVTVKEMMQNAFDAVKALIEKGEVKNPRINIKLNEEKRTITIIDNGSGMTAETLGGPFLTIADSLKETKSASGGFGIAKMLVLFANKEIRVTTMRDGKISTMTATGPQIFDALENQEEAPLISTVPSVMYGKGRGEDWRDIFPEGHGTRVEVVLPESYKNNAGEQIPINFRVRSTRHDAVMHSPLFRDIDVTWDRQAKGGIGATEPLPIGKNFPYDKFTQFANVNFKWGTARIYISKDEKEMWGDNIHVLSNGIYQFAMKIPKKAGDTYGESLPRELYVDIAPAVKAGDSAYPFALDRQGMTKAAKEDFDRITNYISTLYNQADLSTAVKNFGDVEYYGASGKPEERIKLEPKVPKTATALTAIDEGEKIEVKDGQLIVKGRTVPELSGDTLRAAHINLDELKMDQADVDPNRVMLHDNIEVHTGPNGYTSLVTLGREEFGPRFDAYVHGVGEAYKQLRDIVSKEMGYPKLAKEAIGISFDQEYRGVSIKIPFDGMFLNPAVPQYTDPVGAAVGMVGTMIHEFAHHKVRSHDADFPAEMQKIIIALDRLEYAEGERTTLAGKQFSLVEFKKEVINLVKEHEDVLKWLNSKVIETGETDDGQPLVRNRGKRFKDSGNRQATDAGVPESTGGSAEAVPSGYEALRPAFQELGGEPGPPELAKGDRGGEVGPVERASEEVTETPGAAQAVVAIKRARRSLYLDPILTRGKTLNIDQTMYRRLSDLVEKSQIHILTKAIDIARKRVKEEVSAAWKAEEAKLTPKVERALLRTPVWAADRFFNWDKGVIPGGKKLPWKDMTELGKEGVENWAQFFGFDTGSDMVKQVLQLEQERADDRLTPKKQLDQHVAAAVKQQMEAKHGTKNEAIAIAASDEALASWNLDLLDQELKMLAAAHGVEPPLTRDQLADWQKENFGREKASEVSYEKRRRETEKNGKDVEKSLLKQDPTQALMDMQERIKSYLLAREAKGFEAERKKTEKLFDKYAHDANLPQVDQEYTDHIQKLLKTVGAKVARTIENIDYNLGGKNISQFIAEKTGQGRLIVEANLPVDDAGGLKKLEDYTVNEYRDFTTMIRSLDHNGRFEKVIEVRGKREEFYGVIDRIAKSLDTMEKKGFDPKVKGPVSGVRALTRYIDAKLLKAENLLSWIDKNNPLGTFNATVIRPLIEGEQAKGDLMTKLSGLASAMPGDRKWSHALNDPVPTNPQYSLRDDMGQIINHTNEEKISIALNYGNKGNRDLLTRAHGWSEGEIESFLAATMSGTDWDVVNAIHGLFKPLAPLVEAATRERSGVAIPLVDATPFLGSEGGYYPLVRDPADVITRVKQDVDLFDKTKFDPLPMAPALKQRTGKVYKLDLSLNSLNGILSQTAHAVTMQGPVVNANKVLRDQFVREGISKAFGPEYVKMLDEWLKDIANNGGEHDSSPMSWLSRNLRQNVVTQLMGYKVSTAAIHGVSAGASSVYELGKLHAEDKGAIAFATAPLELIKNIAALGLGNLPVVSHQFFSERFVEKYNEAQEQSGELRNRQRTAQSNLEQQMAKVFKRGWIDEAAHARFLYQTYAMAMVSYIDLLTATPVWLAARDHAIASGHELEDAIFIADKAVREAHGSASLVSRANVGRGEFQKWMTIAYNGYWNHNYNKYRSESQTLLSGGGEPPRGTRPGEVSPGEPGGPEEEGPFDDPETNKRFNASTKVAMGAAFLTAFIVVPSIMHHAVRGKKEDTLGGTIASMGASQLMGTVPLLNTLTYAAIHGRDPSVSPFDEVLKSATDLFHDIISKKPAKHMVSHAFKVGGYFGGLPPTNQFLDSGSFMNDVFNGKVRPQTPGQWARGVFSLGDKGKKP